MVKKISKNNLPDKKVLAFGEDYNNEEDIMVGYLNRDEDNTTCSLGSKMLRNVTHYISSSDLIKMFKDSKER